MTSERHGGVGGEEAQGVDRIKRQDDGRRGADVGGAKHADRDKPDHHDRTEDTADACGAVALDQEQADQNRDRHRHDEGS